uniref:Uncharacterized protein n=1 Tax=Arundo donax TaxID=35708 RepID=A0A0A9B801_ARUDO
MAKLSKGLLCPNLLPAVSVDCSTKGHVRVHQ